MKDTVGLCPVCNKAVLVKNNMLYFICPHCDETSSLNEAKMSLDSLCSNPAKTGVALKMCLDLNKTSGAEVPMRVCELLLEHQPYNEDIAFTYVRLSGYAPHIVKQYLNGFCEVKRQTSYASEFLDKVLQSECMQWANQLSQYIDNKLDITDRKKYRDLFNELKASYVYKPVTQTGMVLIYCFYSICSVLNIVLAVLFIFVFKIAVYWNLLIAFAVLFCEIGLLFLHNRAYGNRIGIGGAERALMVTFIASMLIAIGAVAIGAFV